MKEALTYKTTREDRVPMKRKICYALGASPEPLFLGTVGGFIMVFFNGVLGVPGKWVGTVMLVPRIWDAVTDPWIGRLSDNSKSRFGRRRPFILIGGLAMAATYALLWSPPRWLAGNLATTMYLLVVSVLFFSAYTVYNIPRQALGYELTPDYKERTALMATQKFFHSAGEMLIGTMPLMAGWWALTLGREGDDRLGYLATGITFALFSVIMVVTTFLGTKERKATEVAAQMGLWESMMCTLRNRLFLRLTLAVFALVISIMTLASYVNYLFLYYLESRKLLAVTSLYSGILGMPFALVWWWIANRIGKSHAIFMAQGMVVLACFSTLVVFNRTFPYLVFIYSTVYAFGWTGLILLAGAIMADITDIDELETGQRREGSYSGVFGFIFKLGVAGSTPLLGFGVDWVGFDPALGASQTPETFLKLRLATALVSAFFAVIGMALLWRFPLTPARALEVRRMLEERRGETGAIR